MHTLLFRSITEADAREVLGWRYPEPYTLYTPDPAEFASNLRGLLDPANRYYAVLAEPDALVGYCCYGPDARVPGGSYDATALDIGLGLRPDLTGRGLGAGFLRAVLAYGRASFAPPRFRLTVAVFNERARRVYAQSGFRAVAHFRFAGAPDGREFVTMVED